MVAHIRLTLWTPGQRFLGANSREKGRGEGTEEVIEFLRISFSALWYFVEFISCSLAFTKYHSMNRPVSYSQLPLITMTIDSFLQYEPRLDVKYSLIPEWI